MILTMGSSPFCFHGGSLAIRFALTTHIRNSPLPVNPSPTNPYTGTSKESPPILNSPSTYTGSTVPTLSIPLILQEAGDVTCKQPRDPFPHRFDAPILWQ